MLKKVQHIHLYTTPLLAFLIPLFKPWVPAMIVIWLVSIIPLIKLSSLKQQFKSNRFLLLFALFYLWHIMGLIYSENKSNAFFDLEVKLSLFLIPIFFILIPYNRFLQNAILKSFIEGCIASLILCFLQAAYTFYYTQQTSSFFYADLSYFHHPSYASLFAMFAIAVLVEGFFDNLLVIFNKYISIAFLFLLLLFIIMLFSKIAILLCILLLFYYLIRAYIVFKFNIIKVLSGLLIIFFAISFILKSDVITDRFNEFSSSISQNESDETGGTPMRSAIWTASLQLISKNSLIGFGTGDTKEELVNYYNQNSISIAKIKKLNAHNQFLQTALTLGVPSALFLFAILVYYMLFAIKNKNIIYVLFTLFIIFNFLVESMFETQAGVVFFAFVNSLLYWHQKNFINP